MAKAKKATNLSRRQLDKKLESIARSGIYIPHDGWIRAVREALGMSQAQLAKRLQVTRQTLNRVEKAEVTGSIEIKTLRKIAQALGCELAYVLIPKTKSLEKTLLDQATLVARKIVDATEKHMALENQQTDKKFQEKAISELADEIANEGGKKVWGV
jgi:predicted DNA-binding mobile mystery protein A